MATGEADIDRCPPGGAEGIVRLATLTGRPEKPLNPAHGTEGPRTLAVADVSTGEFRVTEQQGSDALHQELAQVEGAGQVVVNRDKPRLVQLIDPAIDVNAPVYEREPLGLGHSLMHRRKIMQRLSSWA